METLRICCDFVLMIAAWHQFNGHHHQLFNVVVIVIAVAAAAADGCEHLISLT